MVKKLRQKEDFPLKPTQDALIGKDNKFDGLKKRKINRIILPRKKRKITLARLTKKGGNLMEEIILKRGLVRISKREKKSRRSQSWRDRNRFKCFWNFPRGAIPSAGRVTDTSRFTHRSWKMEIYFPLSAPFFLISIFQKKKEEIKDGKFLGPPTASFKINLMLWVLCARLKFSSGDTFPWLILYFRVQGFRFSAP